MKLFKRLMAFFSKKSPVMTDEIPPILSPRKEPEVGDLVRIQEGNGKWSEPYLFAKVIGKTATGWCAVEANNGRKYMIAGFLGNEFKLDNRIEYYYLARELDNDLLKYFGLFPIPTSKGAEELFSSGEDTFESSKPQPHKAHRELEIGDIVRIKDSALVLDFFPYSRGQIVEKHLKGYYAVKEENGCTYLYPGHWLTLVPSVEKAAPAQATGSEKCVSGIALMTPAVEKLTRLISEIQAVLNERAQEKPQHTPETVKLLQEIYNFADIATRYADGTGVPVKYRMLTLLDDIKKNVDAILEGRAPDRPPGPQHPPRVPGHNPVA